MERNVSKSSPFCRGNIAYGNGKINIEDQGSQPREMVIKTLDVLSTTLIVSDTGHYRTGKHQSLSH